MRTHVFSKKHLGKLKNVGRKNPLMISLVKLKDTREDGIFSIFSTLILQEIQILMSLNSAFHSWNQTVFPLNLQYAISTKPELLYHGNANPVRLCHERKGSGDYANNELPA